MAEINKGRYLVLRLIILEVLGVDLEKVFDSQVRIVTRLE